MSDVRGSTGTGGDPPSTMRRIAARWSWMSRRVAGDVNRVVGIQFSRTDVMTRAGG